MLSVPPRGVAAGETGVERGLQGWTFNNMALEGVGIEEVAADGVIVKAGILLGDAVLNVEGWHLAECCGLAL